MDTPLISIILPTYNRCEMLRGALECLLHQETNDQFTYEIIVVDNASSDATKTVVEEVAATSPVPVRYFYQTIPGDGATRNCGIAHAQGMWLAFVDDDELAAPDWLRQLFQAAQETASPIVGGAVHLNLPEETLAQLSRFVRATSLREIDYYATVHPYTGKRLPGTGNALVAKHVMDTIGIFDASKICGESDSDFFMRARSRGVALYYTPHAIVKHRVAPNRLTVDYFRWDAQQGCNAFAGLDYKFKGPLKLSMLCIARLGHAALVVVPKLVWGWIRRDSAEVLGQRVRLWRTEGYVRRTLAILAPALFPQTNYFADLEFRRGRVVGKQTVAAEAVA
ncbi:MAG TPA: glycosyltransferase family 2 protein [Pirellulales bacterium]|jgi:glycosyltransferase involved in cell wall biosynthesis|nr:glycosyltransferase family 2 protein [Pirellulales bacterium]